MSFNGRLKELLKYKNMRVKELADCTGVPKRTLDNYTRDDYSIPPADVAVKIARALDVSVEYLLTDELNRMAVNAPVKTPVVAEEERGYAHEHKGIHPTVRDVMNNLVLLDEQCCMAVYNLTKSLLQISGKENQRGRW